MSPYIYAGLKQQQNVPRSVAQIQAVVAEHYDLLPSELDTVSKRQPTLQARHLVLYIYRLVQPTLHYTQLGKQCFARPIGRKAVKYAITTIENLLQFDEAFALQVNTLLKTLHIPSSKNH